MAGTIREIAERAGVSRGTVDRALNKRGRIDKEVEERIFQIVEEIGYVAKKEKKVVKKELVKIGIVTQLAKSSFMIPIRKGLEDAQKELKKRGIAFVMEECVTVSEEEQLAAIERLEKSKVSGIAIMPVECDKIRDKINFLIEQGISVVTFNTDIVGTKRSCFVGQDNKRSGRTAAGLMGMLTGGQGKILAITGYFGNSVNSMRVDGFVDEIKRTFPELELVGVQSSFDEKEEVEKILVNTLTAYPDLQGAVIFSGGQGGVKKAFEELKLEKKPHIIIYDLTTGNRNALEEGIADFLIDQNGYTQGYRVLFILADIMQAGSSKEPEFFYTDIIIKTKYNI